MGKKERERERDQRGGSSVKGLLEFEGEEGDGEEEGNSTEEEEYGVRDWYL